MEKTCLGISSKRRSASQHLKIFCVKISLVVEGDRDKKDWQSIEEVNFKWLKLVNRLIYKSLLVLIEGTKKFNCWAVVVKLVDTPSWGGGDESRVSSSLTDGTKIQKAWLT